MQGPPIYISDRHALPLADKDKDTHVCKLWYADDGLERSAKLKGALEGDERNALWEKIRQILAEMEGKDEDTREYSQE